MKRLILIFLAAGMFACQQKPSYQLSVKLDGGEGKVFLSQRVKGDWVKRDSATLANGECTFKGEVKNPDVYYLGVENKNEKLVLFLENAVISVSGKADSLASAKVTGSAIQNEFNALQAKLDELDAKGMAFYNQSKEKDKEGQKAQADSLMTLSDQVFAQIDDRQKEYIKTNPASWVSPYLLGRIYYEMEGDVLDGYLKGLDPKLDSMNTVIALKDRVNKLALVAVGQTAPDFTMNDTEGNPVKLSDVYSKNEYTLIDFWASWCGPCRRENPNVVANFEQYKGKGFSVMGVSLDRDKDKWLKAIEDDKLTWAHVSDLKQWKNEAAALYSVNSIPANVLVDKTGKIVARNLHGDKLGETLAGLLK